MTGSLAKQATAAAYILLNILSGTTIVFLNKAVFSIFGFHFIYALAFIHALVTAIGMWLFGWCGVFQPKRLPLQSTVPLAVSYLGYIVCWNSSLQINPVGFYQLSKVMVTPAVMALEVMLAGKWPSRWEQSAVVVLTLGVALATVTDPHLQANTGGLLIGAAAVCFSAVYQVQAGRKQKELQASSMQLMHQYCPWAAVFLGMLVPVLEPTGWNPVAPPDVPPSAPPDTLLGYPYTPASILTIGATAVLGLLVSLSTLLVIAATSSVTFNVAGHSKAVIIITGGVMLFGDVMPAKKLCGVLLALGGIGWYSWLRLNPAKAAAEDPSTAQPLLGTNGGKHGGEMTSLPHHKHGSSPEFQSSQKASEHA